MPVVKMPDGTQVSFPDDMPPEQIKGLIATKYPDAVPKGNPQGQGRHLSYEEGLQELEKENQSGLGGKIGAAMTGFIGDMPIIGAPLLGGAKRAAAGIASLIDGEDYGANLDQAQRVVQAAQDENPMSRMGGGIAGNVAAMAGAGGTAAGARLLGMTGPSLIGRAGMSALSSGAIAGADTAIRGGDASDVVNSTAIGAGVGGAIPIVGAGIKRGLQAVGDYAFPFVNAVRNPAQEAERRVGAAMTRDATANPGMVMSNADEAVAAANNIPIANVDRGGETTRALARSVANQSPEARASIENLASDRYGAQSQRATNFIRRLTGGAVDDLAYQENLTKLARASNGPAYKAAFDDPAAQIMFSPRIQQLMQSPSFRSAIDDVPTRSADRGAVQGFKEIQSPFSKNSQGNYVLRRDASGKLIAPNLRFWDQVKQNLDSSIGTAKRAGDNQTASDLMGLKTALLGELDTAVSSYKTARQGAAAFFGAEDALEAGKSFANTPRLIPEAQKAFQKFSPAEKEAFSTGYASELIDKIKISGDRSNVINTVFKNQAARESMELVFGPKKLKEIEAYVRVEDLVDRLRGAMGNSTTARQLAEIGLGGAAGGAYTGDWTGAIGGGLLAGGARYAGKRVDAKVMENIAKLLTQDNPSALRVAVQQAARNPAYMGALEKMGTALAAPVRGGASAFIQ